MSFHHSRLAVNLFIRLVLFWLLPGFIGTAFAQKPSSRKTTKPAVMQGICGTVLEKRGNYMPQTDVRRPNPNGLPVERDMLIFPLLNAGQVRMNDSGFIDSTGDVKPIKTVKSGKDGKFCVSLPIGRYTVLVREPKGLYANVSDAESNFNPVTVGKNKKSQITVQITHQAVF